MAGRIATVLLVVIAMVGSVCWPPDLLHLSWKIDCGNVSEVRGREICSAFSDSLEWTWMGHAIIAPGWNLTPDGVLRVYCRLGISDADIPALEMLQEVTRKKIPDQDTRLEAGVEWLIDAIHYDASKPEGSYLRRQGCGEAPRPVTRPY